MFYFISLQKGLQKGLAYLHECECLGSTENRERDEDMLLVVNIPAFFWVVSEEKLNIIHVHIVSFQLISRVTQSNFIDKETYLLYIIHR